MSEPLLDSEVIWHDVEYGAYDADLPTWLELATEAGGPLLELGAGTGRVARGLAARGFDVVRPRQRARARRRARQARGGRRGRDRDGLRRRPRARARARVRRDHRPDAVHPPARRGARARPPSSLRRGRICATAGSCAAALLADETVIDGEDAGPAPRRSRARPAGSSPASRSRSRSTPTAIEVRRLRQVVSPGGELSERTASIHLDRLTPEAFEHEAAALGLRRPGADRGPPHRRPRRLDDLRARGAADGAPPARPLPGADEHLRRPRQPPVPPPALRVARDRIPARRRRARRAVRPRRPRPDLHRRRPGPRPAAGRRATCSRPSATRSPRRSPTAPPCSRSAAATSCSATATSSASERIEGLGLADLETIREPGPRLIGNVSIEADLGDGGRGARRVREPRRSHPPRARTPSPSAGCLAAMATTAPTASRASGART